VWRACTAQRCMLRGSPRKATRKARSKAECGRLLDCDPSSLMRHASHRLSPGRWPVCTHLHGSREAWSACVVLWPVKAWQQREQRSFREQVWRERAFTDVKSDEVDLTVRAFGEEVVQPLIRCASTAVASARADHKPDVDEVRAGSRPLLKASKAICLYAGPGVNIWAW
jgi:hypothetical protein